MRTRLLRVCDSPRRGGGPGSCLQLEGVPGCDHVCFSEGYIPGDLTVERTLRKSCSSLFLLQPKELDPSAVLPLDCLLAFVFFDANWCGYLHRRDLERILLTLGLRLSAEQVPAPWRPCAYRAPVGSSGYAVVPGAGASRGRSSRLLIRGCLGCVCSPGQTAGQQGGDPEHLPVPEPSVQPPGGHGRRAARGGALRCVPPPCRLPGRMGRAGCFLLLRPSPRVFFMAPSRKPGPATSFREKREAGRRPHGTQRPGVPQRQPDQRGEPVAACRAAGQRAALPGEQDPHTGTEAG